MPLTKISMKKGRDETFKKQMMQEIYLAMHETFDVPEDDFFMSITEHDDETFSFSKDYMNIKRTDGLIMIQITAKFGRSTKQKKALYMKICERLATNLDMRQEDIFIALVETKPENWSFGLGKAQLAWGDYGLLKDVTRAEGAQSDEGAGSRAGKFSLWL